MLDTISRLFDAMCKARYECSNCLKVTLGANAIVTDLVTRYDHHRLDKLPYLKCDCGEIVEAIECV